MKLLGTCKAQEQKEVSLGFHVLQNKTDEDVFYLCRWMLCLKLVECHRTKFSRACHLLP